MRVLIVKPREIPITKVFPSLNAIKSEIGIKQDNWETVLINDGEAPYNGIGIIQHDQGLAGRRKQNILGIRGAFAVVGYDRTITEDGTIHAFTGLTDEQLRLVRTDLARMAILGGGLR